MPARVLRSDGKSGGYCWSRVNWSVLQEVQCGVPSVSSEGSKGWTLGLAIP